MTPLDEALAKLREKAHSLKAILHMAMTGEELFVDLADAERILRECWRTPPAEATCWLIEGRWPDKHVSWWSARRLAWCHDALKAMRFARKRDAEALIALMDMTNTMPFDVYPCEHGFAPLRNAPTPPAVTDEREREIRRLHQARIDGGTAYDRFEDEMADLLAKLDAARAERDTLRVEVEQYRRYVREHRYVDATPDDGLVARILESYIDESYVTDNTLGLPPDNPLCVQMNADQAKRNEIIRKALADNTLREQVRLGDQREVRLTGEVARLRTAHARLLEAAKGMVRMYEDWNGEGFCECDKSADYVCDACRCRAAIADAEAAPQEDAHEQG